jgi:DNA-binding GntR family transcriptional regulator
VAGSSFLRDEAYESLRRKIVTLELEPGASFNEAQLAEMTGATRFGIRSAVGRLREERLLRVIPRGLTMIAPIDLQELRDAYEVRTHLELLIAPLATRRATDRDLAELRRLSERADQAAEQGKLVAAVQLPREFYARLAALTGNSVLEQEHRFVLAMTERFEHYRVRRLDSPRYSVFGELCKAVCDRDPEAASRVVDVELRAYRKAALAEFLDVPAQPVAANR